MFLSMSPFLQFHSPKLYPLPLFPLTILNNALLVSPQVDQHALGGGPVDREDEARRGADVPGGGRVDREAGGADVPGGGLVNRVAGGVWQHQGRADPGREGPILYPYSPSDIFCFLCM